MHTITRRFALPLVSANTVPKTGDSLEIVLWIAAAVVAVALIVFVVIRMKKTK
ncbi:MAG: LPXTG cell wall anchor domain-containing protein [Oscillospiraceae bacterium]|jgi:LPXTG-motif cell wall-anchored protein|nr:LPXTG cell wall anchor domain-containing protein [Oscillospiraceae bacterium]